MARRARAAQPPAEATIHIHKSPGTRYRSTIERADGVQVALEGGSWNKIGGRPGRVPHDVAHYVVEQELAAHGGLWGILARGGLVKNASFSGGKLPPHAEQRAREITTASRDDLMRIEVMVRAVADASLAGTTDPTDLRRHITDDRWWDPALTADALARIDERLRDHASTWEALPAHDTLTLAWRTPAAR
ncbi:MAG: hypothetical protein PGN13_01625 [Patulibacter minatonensis]